MRKGYGQTLAAVLALAWLSVEPKLAWAEVGYPSGIQDFEAMAVGASVTTLPNWVLVNDSGDNFKVVAANDVMGVPQLRCKSQRWLRSTDIDAANVQNRFYSPEIIKQAEPFYHWRYYVNLEATPPGGAATKPKLTIQHRDGANAYQNAWGIEFTGTGANLIVLGIGGTAASMPLYPLTGSTAVGQWVMIDMAVNFTANTVSAKANNGAQVSLPINLNGNQNRFRFCYRGEGTGNVQQLLVDDVEVCVCADDAYCCEAAVCPTVSFPGVFVMAGLVIAAGGVVVARRRKVVAVNH